MRVAGKESGWTIANDLPHLSEFLQGAVLAQPAEGVNWTAFF